MRQLKNLQFGKYQLLEQIGTGGMAEVFKARYTGEMGFEKLLVIKKVLPHLAAEDQWTEQFVDEARLAAFLHHENIIHIYDFGSIDGSWFLAMEYLAGQDLRSVIQAVYENGNTMPQELVLHIIAKLCEGLDYAHGLTDMENTPLNIVHRDISPRNIYITYDGHVKIIDFGIAKTTSQSRHTHTQTGTIKGKFAYMSPEQASAKPVDHRSDIYAAGLVLYELFTGQKVFTGEIHEVLQNVAAGNVIPPENAPNIPEKLCPIINKALAKDPNDRYQSCGDMLVDIDDYIYETGLRTGARKLGVYLKALFHDAYEHQQFNTLPTEDYDARNHDRTAVLTASIHPASTKLYARYLRSIIGLCAHVVSVGLFYGIRLPAKKMAAFSRSFMAYTAGVISGPAVSGCWQKARALIAGNKKVIVIIAIILVVAAGLLIKQRVDQNKIELLFEKAQVCLEVNRLIAPKEDSAAYYYTRILTIDDNNLKAQKGLAMILEQSIRQAENLLSVFRHEKAQVYIQAGLTIDPGNEKLLELKATAEKNVSDRIFGGFKNLFNGSDQRQTDTVPDDRQNKR